MKNSILLFYFLCACVITSCTQMSGKSMPYNDQYHPVHIKTGEDDDQPTYIQVTRKKTGGTASGVSISLIDIDSDTLFAQTDSNGLARFQLSHYGNYSLSIKSPIYQNVYDVITINNPLTTRIDSLETE